MVETYPARLSAISQEARIVWLDLEAVSLPYVREMEWPSEWRTTKNRLPYYTPPSRRMPHSSSHRAVAYSELGRDARRHGSPFGSFMRRVWWVRDTDPYPDGGYPCEGVDPKSIFAGQLSRRPPRRSDSSAPVTPSQRIAELERYETENNVLRPPRMGEKFVEFAKKHGLCLEEDLDDED